MQFSTRSTTRGFTLIELLVVIAIIGLLSAVVLASLNTARLRGNDSRRIQEMVELQKAVETYYTDYGHYPITNNTWVSFDSPTYSVNPVGGTPSAASLAAALATYIAPVIDPRTTSLGTNAGMLFWGNATDYCIMDYRIPENMNNYPAAMVDTTRCTGAIVNGQCSAGVNAVYIGRGVFAGGC